MTRRLILAVAVLLLCLSMLTAFRRQSPVLSAQAQCASVRVVTLDPGSAQHHSDALRMSALYLYFERAAEGVVSKQTRSAHFHRIAARAEREQ